MTAIPFGGPPATPGTVALVGGGPGDPGLVTLRAARLLSTATFVAFDRLSPPQLVDLCSPACERVYVGKLADRHALSQDQINALLVAKATQGHAVVRFKGGDPFVLGRGSEEAAACAAAGVPFQVVPGVTSAVAAPAYAGIPVTHRTVAPAFAVVTGHEDPTKSGSQVDWDALARFPGTLLLLMAIGRMGEIAASLTRAGKPADTPIALVRWGTTPQQQTLVATLADVAERVAATGFSSPAVAIIGEVVALRDRIGWFEPDGPEWVARARPLHGRRVLVARTRHQASELSERLRALGADPVEAPTIAIEPGRDPQRLRMCLAQAADGAFDWVALTSANGVSALWAALRDLGRDARLLARTRLAAVGPGTAEALEARGLHPDLVPDRFTTADLAQSLIDTGGPARVLLPRADLATPALADTLRAAGWQVTEVEAYRTAPVPALESGVVRDLREGTIDAVAFASSSTVRNLVALLGGPLHPAVRVASIGPVTSRACAQLGLRVDAQAARSDLDGLVAAVVAAVGSGQQQVQAVDDRGDHDQLEQHPDQLDGGDDTDDDQHDAQRVRRLHTSDGTPAGQAFPGTTGG